MHQDAAIAAKSHVACRQVIPRNRSEVRSAQSTGVSPPMSRAHIQTADLAKPRSVAGNQL